MVRHTLLPMKTNTVRVEISRFSWVADDTKIIHVKVELLPAKLSKQDTFLNCTEYSTLEIVHPYGRAPRGCMVSM